jgi:peptidyl-prolyl cis-trans isomerase B (cyclophilin B)
MTGWAKHGKGAGRRWIVAALLGALMLTGCSKQPASSEQAGGAGQETLDQSAAPTGERGAVSAPRMPDAEATSLAPPAAGNWQAMHEPFAKATRGGEDPPANSNPPPDVTISGKPVYKIYKEVLALWDTIRFVTPDGKPIRYSAVIETDFGAIEITLRPDLAPNHVRNFVALARAGYYDGLFFDRICHDETEVEPGKVQVFDSIEAGCPLGNGDPGNGSIGYWLKPEFPVANAKVTHEPGTVGACRGMEEDSAACRFYITLCDAPFLDGNFTVFGKVTQGLEVARTIAKQPTREHEEDVAGSFRPDKPIQIKKVTIQTSVEETGR